MCIRDRDKTWRGVRPFRTYYGFKYEGGFSDHLPLTVDFLIRSQIKRWKENLETFFSISCYPIKEEKLCSQQANRTHMEINLASIRQEYTKGGLRESELPDNPFLLFSQWLQEAIDSKVAEPTAMLVGTVSPDCLLYTSLPYYLDSLSFLIELLSFLKHCHSFLSVLLRTNYST